MAVQDIADAVTFVRVHAEEYKIDPDNYYFIGEFAWEHLAILSGARDRHCNAIVPLYAVYDIAGFHDFLAGIGQKKVMPELAAFRHMSRYSVLTGHYASRCSSPAFL